MEWSGGWTGGPEPTHSVVCVCVCVGGGTLIFSYIRRLGSFFRVQNFEDFVDINLGVIPKLDYI